MKKLGGDYLSRRQLAAAGFRRLGRDVLIHDRASLYGLENISIGDHVRIDDFAVIVAANGTLDIGSHVSIGNFCLLAARNGIVLEDFVTLAPGVRIFTASDDYSGHKMTNITLPAELTGGAAGPVVLERHVIVGASSVILPGCRLGEGAAVGALSLVKGSLPAWGIYGGLPVRRLAPRSEDLLKLEDRLRALTPTETEPVMLTETEPLFSVGVRQR